MNILFDIGGSRMRFARVIGTNNISEPIIIKTPDTYMESMVEIKRVVEELSINKAFGKNNGEIKKEIKREEEIENLIGGIAGVFDKDGKKLVLSPNLKEWENKPLFDDLKRMTGAKNVVIKNDTDMTGLGEAVYGAGRDHKIVAYLTFSTGIGGSLIVDQKVAPYRFGFEPGFQIIDKDNMRPLHDVSGTALKERYNGKLFKDITDTKTREKIMRAVIAGIHNTIVFWSPDVVVLGGGMTESFEIDYIYKELEKIQLRFPELPEIKFAEIEDTNGLYGALAYLNNLKF